MFDWEIENFLRENNYELDQHKYLYLCINSPQLDHVKYDPYEDIFEAWSSSSYFKFKVHCKE